MLKIKLCIGKGGGKRRVLVKRECQGEAIHEKLEEENTNRENKETK